MDLPIGNKEKKIFLFLRKSFYFFAYQLTFTGFLSYHLHSNIYSARYQLEQRN